MEEDQKIATFREMGLTSKEASLYMASLRLGAASITQLARRAGMKRPTAYLVIDELLKKGFFIAVPKGKKLHYKSENPETLAVETAKKHIQAQNLLSILGKDYQKNSIQPKMRLYEGKNRIRSIYEEIFRSKEIWAMVSVNKFLKLFDEEDNEHFFRILSRHGGMLHDLIEDTKKAREFIRFPYRTAISETKILPHNMNIAIDVLVFDGKAALISFDHAIVMIIEDPAIASTFKSMLQSFWNS